MSDRSEGVALSARRHACHLTCLPLELLTFICTYLSREQLRRMRLVSHILAKAVQPELFRIIFLKINTQSFEKLRKISENVELRRYVKVINYDPTKIHGGDAQVGYSTWLYSTAATGLGYFNFGVRTKRNYLKQFYAYELEKCYFNFCSCLFGQQFLLRDSNWKKLLAKALRNLSRVSSLQYSSYHYEKSARGMFDRSDLPAGKPSSLARQILAEPSVRLEASHESNIAFWTMVDSARASSVNHQIKQISGAELDFGSFREDAAEVGASFEGLPNLQHLSLEFERLPWGDDEAKLSLSNMIAGLPSLRSLSLRFAPSKCAGSRNSRARGYQTSYPCFGCTNLSDVFGARWENLSTLQLGRVRATDEVLRNVVTKHAPNLRLLEITTCSLSLTLSPPEYTRNSSLQLFQYLSRSSSLERIAFDGVCTSTRDEWFFEAIQIQRVNKYDAFAFCGCAPPIRHAGNISYAKIDGPSWVYGDLTGWFDGQLRELCICKDKSLLIDDYPPDFLDFAQLVGF